MTQPMIFHNDGVWASTGIPCV